MELSPKISGREEKNIQNNSNIFVPLIRVVYINRVANFECCNALSRELIPKNLPSSWFKCFQYQAVKNLTLMARLLRDVGSQAFK